VTNSPLCQFLEWDSGFFGFRIARIAGDRFDQDTWTKAREWCSEEAIRCLYLLVEGADTESSLIAAAEGFRPVDIRITLDRKTSTGTTSFENIRPASSTDVPWLMDLAGSSHTDSRFYADPDFPRELCSGLYRMWIRKSCHGYARAVLVAEKDGQPAGYVTCNWSGDDGQIGLIAVSPWAQGQGIGISLVNAAIQECRDNGINRISVVTQGRNIPAQRLYQRCGFMTRSLQLWFHKWF
jgi:dTDP-4-amino-4,6-dideoxy-D-galactose acyltransferase